MLTKLFPTALLAMGLIIPSGAFASDNSNPSTSGAEPAATAMVQKTESPTESHRVGISFKTSLLGMGADVAIPVTQRSNVRVGFSTFNYSRGFDKDGVGYTGELGLHSVQALYDFFPFAGGFHISPGALIYNGNGVSAKAAVPGGSSFSLGGSDYVSSASNPVTGNGKIQFNKAAPMFLIGFGNLARRSERHFGMTFDIGAVYQGSGRMSLNLAGSACDSTGINCQSIASDPTIQSNILAEQNKINHSIAPYKFYPVISIGFGYKF